MKARRITALLLCAVLSLTGLNSNYIAAAEQTQEYEFAEFSEEYLSYLDLSDEEKSKVRAPLPFDRPEAKASDMRSSSGLPSYFDGRAEGYLSPVRDQGKTSSCWTFTSTANLASYLNRYQPSPSGESYDFSPFHIDFATSSLKNGIAYRDLFDRSVLSGAPMEVSPAYYFAGLGPVNNAGDMAFYDFVASSPVSGYVPDVAYSQLLAKPVAQMLDYRFMPEYSPETIDYLIAEMKQAIYEYGSLDAGINWDSFYINNNTYAFYNPYGSTSYVNHAVLIVGWDDSYAKENFAYGSRPSKDGAWIVQNTWGTDTQEDGYFYVSYEELSMYQMSATVTDALNYTNYDNMYSLDDLGMVTCILNGSASTSMSANVFNKEAGSETLTAVSVAAPGPGNYTIYLSADGSLDRNKFKAIASGRFETIGYDTVELSDPVTLTGTKFALIVEFQGIDADGKPCSVGVEMNVPNDIYKNVSAPESSSFFSTNGGGYWTEMSTSKYSYSNFCIDALTVDGNGKTTVSFTGLYPEELVYVYRTDGEKVMPRADGTYSLSQNTKYIYTVAKKDTYGVYSEYSNTFTTDSLSSFTVIANNTALPFTDVKLTDWYYSPVSFCYENGYINGVTPTTFNPKGTANRAALITLLWRLESSPIPSSPADFSDVPQGKYYSDAVAWGTQQGIVNGVGNNLFKPTSAISRQDFAVMLYRYYSLKGTVSPGSDSSLSKFTDSGSISGYARNAIIWCVENGILNGRTATTLVPRGNIQRSEMATMIYRYLNL